MLCLGAWRSPVARTVRVGEVGGSNPLAPTFAQLEASALLSMSIGEASNILLYFRIHRHRDQTNYDKRNYGAHHANCVFHDVIVLQETQT